jgi:hypothetical protein
MAEIYKIPLDRRAIPGKIIANNFVIQIKL